MVDTGGKDRTYAQRTLQPKDLVRPGDYADSWLDFAHDQPGRFEYRVGWPGRWLLSRDCAVVFRKP